MRLRRGRWQRLLHMGGTRASRVRGRLCGVLRQPRIDDERGRPEGGFGGVEGGGSSSLMRVARGRRWQEREQEQEQEQE